MCALAPAAVHFQTLYTTQLTQKRKKWHDGQCRFYFKTSRMRLLDECGRLLAEERWTNDGIRMPKVGDTIIFEKYLVELDSLLKVIDKIKIPAKKSGDSVKSKSNFDTCALTHKGFYDIADSRLSSDDKLESDSLECSNAHNGRSHGAASRMPSHSLTSKDTSCSNSNNVSTPNLYSDTRQMSLSYILKHEVGRLTPYGSVHKDSQAKDQKTIKKLKYSPWGDLDIVSSPTADTYVAKIRETEAQSEPAVKQEELITCETVSEQLGEQGHHNVLDEATHVENDQLKCPDSRVDDPIYSSEGSQCEHNDEDWDMSLTAPLSYDLDSDLESQPDVVDFSVNSQSRVSLFEDIPLNVPKEGPWTKEAYLLFSWHPPLIKKEIE